MKSYTDLEQSKKLAKLLPLESADMYYFLDPTPAGNIYHLTVQRVDVGIKNLPHYDEGDIPCWSLTALLNVLPQSVRLVGIPKDSYWYCECVDRNNQWYAGFGSADNQIDACYQLIEKLHEQKLL